MVKKISLCGILSAFSLLSFMLENLFPPLFIPNGRLGLSNIFILLTGIISGYGYGIFALSVKAVLGSIFTGNVSALIYALPSGLIAYTVQMLIIIYSKRFSIVAASVAGGTMNSVLQGLTFCLVTSTAEYIAYIPYLALVGALGGLTVGLCVFAAIKFLPDRFLSVNKYNGKGAYSGGNSNGEYSGGNSDKSDNDKTR